MEKSQTGFELIVIGGSAGSLQVIFRLLSELGRGFSIPVLLILHRYPQDESRLTDVLRAKTGLDVEEAEDKEPLQAGKVYLCPADYHVLIEDDKTFSLDYSEKVNYSRPSIDVAFSSAAAIFKKTLIGVLLSGANADGAEGLAIIKKAGGTTIVQTPADAEVSYMPEQALRQSKADYIVDASGIGKKLKSIVN